MNGLWRSLGVLVLSAWAATQSAAALTGKVMNAETQAPLAGATVTLGTQVVSTGSDGSFDITGDGTRLLVRAPGFVRLDLPMEGMGDEAAAIALKPLDVRALYLSVYGIASSKLRDGAMDLIRQGHANALVIDVKDDRSQVPFKVALPMAAEIGAQQLITIRDIKGLLSGLREQGIYTIARIVVFKDDKLAAAHPEWTVRLKSGQPFRDRERLRWMDPFRHQVWDYNIAIAKEAAEAGFDEVQFDYVRFPDSRNGVFSQPATVDSRTDAITGFLLAARTALAPANVFTSANIFGYVCWNSNDTDIGQKIGHVAGAVDIVSPMLYPSGFKFGIPGFRNPVQHSYEIIHETLKRCQERAQVSPLRFRPWLQAFRDYAFGGQAFGEAGLLQQVKGAADAGTGSYLVWNPRNVYPPGGYRP